MNIPNTQALQSVYEMLAGAMCENFRRDQSIEPMVMAMHIDPDGRPQSMVGLPPALVHELMGSAEGKEMLGRQIQAALYPSDPDALRQRMGFLPNLVATVNEVWVVETPRSELPVAANGEAPKVSSQDAVRALGGVSPSEHPQRKEAALVSLHSQRGTVIGLSPIVREGQVARIELGPLMLDGLAEGRMCVPSALEAQTQGQGADDEEAAGTEGGSSSGPSSSPQMRH